MRPRTWCSPTTISRPSWPRSQEGRGVFDNLPSRSSICSPATSASSPSCSPRRRPPLAFVLLTLLWVNLVTDGLPALALVMDPADPDLLGRPPRRPDEPMLGASEWRLIGGVGAVLAACTLAVFGWALRARDLDEARTLAFSTLVFGLVSGRGAGRADYEPERRGVSAGRRPAARRAVHAAVSGLAGGDHGRASASKGVISLSDIAENEPSGRAARTLRGVAARGARRRAHRTETSILGA